MAIIEIFNKMVIRTNMTSSQITKEIKMMLFMENTIRNFGQFKIQMISIHNAERSYRIILN